MSKNLTALVTGASRGLGLETCRQLLDHGISVILNARTQEAVEHGLRGLGNDPHVKGAGFDVSEERAVDSFIERYWRDEDRLDIVVNNAARQYTNHGSSVADTSPTHCLGGVSAPRSLEEGARGIVWAATLGEDGDSGGFFRDRKQIGW